MENPFFKPCLGTNFRVGLSPVPNTLVRISTLLFPRSFIYFALLSPFLSRSIHELYLLVRLFIHAVYQFSFTVDRKLRRVFSPLIKRGPERREGRFLCDKGPGSFCRRVYLRGSRSSGRQSLPGGIVPRLAIKMDWVAFNCAPVPSLSFPGVRARWRPWSGRCVFVLLCFVLTAQVIRKVDYAMKYSSVFHDSFVLLSLDSQWTLYCWGEVARIGDRGITWLQGFSNLVCHRWRH